MTRASAHGLTTPRAPDWRTYALCRDQDPELWFTSDATTNGQADTEHAKAICRACPVLATCREWALTTRQPFGVWGGLGEKERRNILRQRTRGTGRPKKSSGPKQKREPAKCGTRSGYQRHVRLGEPIDDACRRANTDADNRLRRTGTTKAAA